ncbi:hypothetical protein OG897_08535 [Streptomyces sp. NBC_00237]|uniref:hypothetical protein n=1 Tax=Streptomyces sp. NBC_00237 TaxID=2975687 RepID=UPI0022513A1E|nr:hypothetical protein [Streptomyces sp. NBC_00237]MCX5201498.1 hypothetical protein [Streptomyces sp. NBC_00237]
MNKYSRFAIAAAALVGTLSFAAAPANAANGPTSSVTGASVWFLADGDVIKIRDTKADGLSAVAQVHFSGGVSYKDNLWNNGGNGSTREYSYGTAVPEGVFVYYRACVGKSATHTLVRCDDEWKATNTN